MGGECWGVGGQCEGGQFKVIECVDGHCEGGDFEGVG